MLHKIENIFKSSGLYESGRTTLMKDILKINVSITKERISYYLVNAYIISGISSLLSHLILIK